MAAAVRSQEEQYAKAAVDEKGRSEVALDAAMANVLQSVWPAEHGQQPGTQQQLKTDAPASLEQGHWVRGVQQEAVEGLAPTARLAQVREEQKKQGQASKALEGRRDG